MRKFTRDDQRAMAAWALDCAERVLPLFETAMPGDARPREAIATGRTWVATGEFSMGVIRSASLAAHTAARGVPRSSAAFHAARAAGQAVATAHVAQHAYGGAYYALRAIAAQPGDDSFERVSAEFEWQSVHLPEHLRAIMLPHFRIEALPSSVKVTLTKGPGF